MIKLFKVFMPPEVDAPLLETLHSGNITQGSKVVEFEHALVQKVGNSKVISVNSGTSALSLALRLAGVEYGDEVISTPMTCIATNVPIATAGATIRWADVDPITGLIDPLDVEKRITLATKAIMAVDWGGLPCDYDTLREVAGDIPIISDAAHSLGTTYKGNLTGSVATGYTAFSFQAIKTITTVDGGALTCASRESYQRGKLLRWFGVDRENNTAFRGQLDVPEAGYKYHMNDVNATIGTVALKSLDDLVRNQVAGAAYYTSVLSDFYEVPTATYPCVSASWLVTVLLPDGWLRDKFVGYMADNGVEVSRVHWRNDQLSAFSGFREGYLPGVTKFSDRMVCIPNHYGVSFADREYIGYKMNEFASGQ